MEIVVGKNIGFCFGVANSVNKSLEILKKYNKVYCYGELVHNKSVSNNLKDNGLILIDELDQINNNDNVIIRAHGIPKDDYSYIEKKNLNAFDLTCPKVLSIHKLAERLAKQNYFIILVAKKNHPEAIGTISFCGKNSIIIDSLEDIEKINMPKVAVISQTTYSMDKFKKIVCNLNEMFSSKYEIKVFNTICNATTQRQQEAKDLSKSVDLMIIVGDDHSSNTRKLYDIAKMNCKNSILVQGKEDLKQYINSLKTYQKVGIITGASTSKYDAEEIINFLQNI